MRRVVFPPGLRESPVRVRFAGYHVPGSRGYRTAGGPRLVLTYLLWLCVDSWKGFSDEPFILRRSQCGARRAN
jgi:hypothetical protein